MSRKRKLTSDILRFISENQQMAGYSGRITEETANHEVDLDSTRSPPVLERRSLDRAVGPNLE